MRTNIIGRQRNEIYGVTIFFPCTIYWDFLEVPFMGTKFITAYKYIFYILVLFGKLEVSNCLRWQAVLRRMFLRREDYKSSIFFIEDEMPFFVYVIHLFRMCAAMALHNSMSFCISEQCLSHYYPRSSLWSRLFASFYYPTCFQYARCVLHFPSLISSFCVL